MVKMCVCVCVCVCFSAGEAHWLTHMWVQLLSFAAILLHPLSVWSKSTLAKLDIWAEHLPAISATSKAQRQQNVQLFVSIWLAWLWPEWVVWAQPEHNTNNTKPKTLMTISKGLQRFNDAAHCRWQLYSSHLPSFVTLGKELEQL